MAKSHNWTGPTQVIKHVHCANCGKIFEINKSKGECNMLDDDSLSHMQAAKERDDALDSPAVNSGVRPAYRITPIYSAVDAFWKYWKENGETHKHGFYESTWGAINAALSIAGVQYANKNMGALDAYKKFVTDNNNLIKPLGWISEQTRQWLKDPSGHGPGMFTPNKNGQSGTWAIYSWEDFQKLYRHAEKTKYLAENLLRIADSARRLYEESEEYDFPDGMGKGASQQYWDDLSNAIDAFDQLNDQA